MRLFWDFPAKVIRFTLAKLKSLAIYIVKHPLGSLWWCVKTYLALMFLSLFVACSFGAFAQTATTGTCSIGEVVPNVGCGTSTKYKEQWKWTLSKTVNKVSEIRSFFGDTKLVAQAAACAWAVEVENINQTIHRFSCIDAVLGFERCDYIVENGVTKCKYAAWVKTTLGGTATTVPAFHMCPPEDPTFKDFLTLYQPSANVNKCIKDFDKPKTCFADPKYSIANQYHFAPTDQGKGSVCVPSDNGELCPWKELSGSNGVFQPDKDAAVNACDDKPPSDPMPPPPQPPECSITPSGMKVCKKDPNEHCTANSSNAMSCPPSCGFISNTDFVCFENPDEPPEEPEEPYTPPPPDTPRPPKDDNIEDPDKAIGDMLKKDFKDVQRGVETRLDGFSADFENLLKNEKHGNEQSLKAAQQGNKLLNSINQNTANAVEELKKLSDKGKPVTGLELPEFEDGNNWETRNFATVMKAKGDEIMNIPLMKSINGFFDVSFSGSCPTYSTAVWVFEINIDQFCSPEVQALFPYISAIVLMMCSFFAIRIALL